MNCADGRELLHAYADDELDVATARQLEAHLADCPGCSRALEAARAVKTAVSNPALYHRAPAGLRDRILKSVAEVAPEAPAARVRPGRQFWFPAGLAASVLLVAAAVFQLVSLPGRQQFALEQQEVLDAHIRSLMQPAESHLYDVRSTNQHTVKPWFDLHADFSPPVKQLEDEGFPLEGGRLDYIQNHPTAALVYSSAKHKINLFIRPGESGQSVSDARGYHLIHWTADGMTFWAVSDLGLPSLERFVSLVRGSAPPASRPE